MKPWFNRRAAADAPSQAQASEAYREGRLDERRDEAGGPWARRAAPAAPVVVRRRRGGFGLIGLIVLLVVVFGAVMLYLAARNGSFSAGGAVLDNGLSNATQKAAAPVRNAEDKVGQSLEHAGQDLRQHANPSNP